MRHVVVPPTVMRLMAYDPRVDDYDLSSLKQITSGAAPVGAVLVEAAKKRLNLDSVDQGKEQLLPHFRCYLQKCANSLR